MTSDRPAGVLIIDDDPDMRRRLSSALAPAWLVRTAASGEEGLHHCERSLPNLVLLDMMLPEMGGIAVLRALKRLAADVPVIMMTAYAEVHSAVQAIKLGAADYLQKPIDDEALRRQISKLLEQATTQTPARTTLIGESPAMRRVCRLVDSFAATDIPILLQGETGTGKGLVAAAVHRASKRAQQPFVAIDCATIPDQLAESELFGYEDGAFTGAGKKKRGRVAFADGGTLFLDEIGTLSLPTQAKLLTLLEARHFMPLGARQLEPMRLDARFICATNVALHDAVEAGTFRADVFHRVNGVTIELPPLRDRGEDIERLARHFLGEAARRLKRPPMDISDAALDALREYPWPGNVRELQQVLAAAAVLVVDALMPDDLPLHVLHGADHRAADTPTLPGSLNLHEIKEWAGREAQKRVVEELQKRTSATQQEMARMLGVDPKTLRSVLKSRTVGRPE